jgi:ribosomal protein L7/L12
VERIYNEAQLSSFVDQIRKRLDALEAHAKAVGEKAGVPFETSADAAPPEVVELARSGDRMGAIKRYRELTGASMEEAQGVVGGL